MALHSETFLTVRRRERREKLGLSGCVLHKKINQCCIINDQIFAIILVHYISILDCLPQVLEDFQGNYVTWRGNLPDIKLRFRSASSILSGLLETSNTFTSLFKPAGAAVVVTE